MFSLLFLCNFFSDIDNSRLPVFWAVPGKVLYFCIFADFIVLFQDKHDKAVALF